MQKKILLNWFCTVVSLAGLMIAAVMGSVPIAIVLFLTFSGCALWFSDLMSKWHRRCRARRIEPDSEDDILIDIPLDEFQEQEEVETREIKPGRYQSATYLRMVEGGGTVYENRTEDQTAQA